MIEISGQIFLASLAIAVSIITGGVSFVLKNISSLRKQFNEHELQNARVVMKIDTLWEIYGEEAIRDARQFGMTQRNSPESISDKFIQLITESEYINLLNKVKELLEFMNPYDVSIELFQKNKDLFNSMMEKDETVTKKTIIGVLVVISIGVQDGTVEL